jgi:uncharacterized protein (DUF2336 family)
MTAKPQLIDRLGRATIRQALGGETAEARANAVQAIGRSLRTAQLSDADRAFATTLMTRICKDVSDLVRRALAVTLRNSPELPRELALALIADIDSIAVPILESSPVLTDEDLVDVLNSKAAKKVRAIAQRKTLSLHVTQAIVSFGDSAATAAVAANDSALISPQTAELIAEMHADDDLIREAALSRHDMPPAVIEKLIDHSTRKLDVNLKTYPGMTEGRAARITSATAERARSYVVTDAWPDDRLRDYARSLDKSGKLTPSLLLRAAGRGDIRFVVAGLSVLGGQTPAKTRLMLMSGGPLGARAATVRARFSPAQTHMLTTAVSLYKQVEREAIPRTPSQMQRRLAERLLTSEIEMSEAAEAELMDLLDAHGRPQLV